MNKLIFSTNNEHKLEEVRDILGAKYTILSLKDLGEDVDIPETGETLEENALIKAKYLFDKYQCDCFADDTGLEVEALNNAPGVYSARYAGEQKSSIDNVNKLLSELNGNSNRKARFRTVIVLYLDGKQYIFEGIVKGLITSDLRGEAGFGYDPVFQPDGYDKTFAELGLTEKNNISHRALAIKKLVSFLEKR